MIKQSLGYLEFSEKIRKIYKIYQSLASLDWIRLRKNRIFCVKLNCCNVFATCKVNVNLDASVQGFNPSDIYIYIEENISYFNLIRPV